MIPDQDISETVPRRRARRNNERSGVLLVVGGAADRVSLEQGRPILIGDGAVIGRRPPTLPGLASVAIPDRTVSSVHARISRVADGYIVEDQGSTNGTLVDGRLATGATPLREGSVLFLGAQVLVLRTMTEQEIAAIEEDLAHPFAPVSTMSATLAMMCAKLRRLAPSPIELFLVGETGVGKEVFATGIHTASGRAGPLLAINCAALPRELVESELFGYERGAHSTARARKIGLITAADGGTLFLDELGEMPLDVQSKLLRFLQDRTYFPIGATRAETADVRIVAASSRVTGNTGAPSLQEALLGRLGADPIQILPLRDRVEDLGRLIAHFLRATGCTRTFETEAFQALFLHDWPHNVRELEKVIAEAELLSRDAPAIGFDHLPASIVEAFDKREHVAPPQLKAAHRFPVSTPNADGSWVRPRRPVPSAEELRTLMVQYQGNVTHVARHLGRQWAVISRTLRRYGIKASDFRPAGLPEETPPPEAEVSAEGGAPAEADDDGGDGPDDDGDTLG